MDQLRAANWDLKQETNATRAAALDELSAAWRGTYALLALGAFASFATMAALYLAITRQIVRRFSKVGQDAIAISRGI